MNPLHKLRPTHLCAALIALAAALAVPAAASAATVTVCPSGCTSTTIQGGVTAANATDTVTVAAGTYNESVNVNKTLTIQGAQAGHDARTRAGTVDESVMTGTFTLAANDITVDGFTVSRQNPGDLLQGFAFNGLTGTTIVNNIVRNKTFGIFYTAGGNSDTLIRHNFFDDQVNAPNGDTGVFATGTASDGTVVDANRFSGNSETAINLGGPDDANRTTNAQVTNNTSSGDGTLLVTVNSAGTQVTGNTVEGASGSSIFVGLGVNGITVTGNHIADGLGSGVSLSTAFGGPSASTGVVVTGNDFDNTARGVRAVSGAISGTAQVHFNRFGNPAGSGTPGVVNLGSATIDAQNNWWGCNAGPADANCDHITGTGPVTATSWLVLGLTSGATQIAPQGGSTTLTADLLHTNTGATLTPPPSFPDGVAVGFSTDLGAVIPTGPLTAAGVAKSVLVSGQEQGTATARASLDGQSVSVPVTIAPASSGTAGTTAASGTAGATAGSKKCKKGKKLKKVKGKKKCVKKHKKKK